LFLENILVKRAGSGAAQTPGAGLATATAAI